MRQTDTATLQQQVTRDALKCYIVHLRGEVEVNKCEERRPELDAARALYAALLKERDDA